MPGSCISSNLGEGGLKELSEEENKIYSTRASTRSFLFFCRILQFFQTNQQDKNFDEGVTLATIAAVIWLVFKTYAELEKLP
eukprot:1151337-Pelagomonas_calceolata.AAC.6